MKDNILDRVENLLKSKEKYLSEDKKLLKAKVYSDIMTMDKELLKLLLSDEEIKNTFFVKVDDSLIFDKQKFAWLIDSKEFLPDSYTSYTNKIGLTSDREFISNKNDVVLDFPYKDCILEGGQDKDDQKRKEIFYNETIANDEIRRMLDPKVFTNVKKYTSGGVEDCLEFSENDNLIIKGNNLIALASLLKRYEGKVKCIYIDPPYNTGSDSFMYNDKFNRSSWLTFMKNRLLLAKDLLSSDGTIFIQIDENQSHYLKVLCDEIFGEDNFLNEIVWRYRTYVGQVKDYFPKKHDLILWYKKLDKQKFNMQYVGNFEDTPDYNRWKEYLTKDGKIIYGNHPTTDSRFDAYLNKYIKQFGDPKIGDVIYVNKGYVVDDVWEDIIALDAKNKTERISLFSGSGQKPEALLERIMIATTDKNDIVLDYHLGSGTTCAVAHKMGRRYIGIEQMDYIKDITVERLKKVIDGEQGGISKAVDWQGGGSFVYCELMENGNELIREIENADETTIEDVKAKIYRDERIIPYITREELEKVDKDFEELTLEDKKKALIKLIDKNKLYVNYSDIENKDFDISDKDKKFTRSFYEVV
ncbi:hypothetical protein HMPREF3188_00559 [Tissierellia bacterium KA00581]|nr:hypothetical protein HMPREF3188_00559 [Tissierellia bacterium KA00581]